MTARALSAGTVLARKYQLTRPLGEGAMGVVWAATNVLTSREVALKLILQPDDDLRRRMMREARACGALRHPNIVDIHDVALTDEGEPFLVMELLSGESLDALLARKRRLPPPQAAAIARDVASALAAAHAVGLVHRDVKPANVFLHQATEDAPPVVKVLDFGVSKDLRGGDSIQTVSGSLVGSPLYMSPEQARAEADIDGRADIWSLGVVLFEMLTGTLPWTGTVQEVLVQIVTAEIPATSRRVRQVSPALSDLVARCMARDRDRRLGSAAELARELSAFCTPAAAADAPVSQARSDAADDSRPSRVAPPAQAPTSTPLPAHDPATVPLPSPSAETTTAPLPASVEPLAEAAPPQAKQGTTTAPITRPLLPTIAEAPLLGQTPAQPSPARKHGRPLVLVAALVTVGAASVVAALVLAIPGPPAAQGTSDSPSPAAPGSPASTSSGDPSSTGVDPGVTAADPTATAGDLDEPAPVTSATATDTPSSTPVWRPRPPAAGSATPALAAFNRGAASAAMGAAATAAKACKRPGGPRGAGHARVVFAPDGTVTSVVLDPPFAATPVGACVVKAFRATRVPPFQGSPVAAGKSFTIP